MKALHFEYTHRWADIIEIVRRAVDGDDSALFEFAGIMEDRDRQLEDFLSRTPIIWDRDAAAVRLRSKAWTAKDFGQVREWNVELGQTDAGVDQTQASNVPIELHINGTMSRTMTLTAGQVYTEYDGELPALTPGDRLTLYCASLGFDLVSTVSV